MRVDVFAEADAIRSSDISLKAALRQMRLTALSAAGQLRAVRNRIAREQGMIVLMLHRVIPDHQLHHCRSPRGMVLRESAFISLLRYLAKYADVISPADFSVNPINTTRPRVLITFDDGWADNYLIAERHLAAFNMKACFFVVTDYAGCVEPFWPERVLGLRRLLRQNNRLDIWRSFLTAVHVNANFDPDLHTPVGNEQKLLAWLKHFRPAEILSLTDEALFALDASLQLHTRDPYERLMTWSEMRTLATHGHMIASHTHTHALLTRITERELSEELQTSWLDLRSKAWPQADGSDWISYPNGNVNDSVKAAAYNFGYRFGFTTKPGVWSNGRDSLAIPRMNIWDGSLLSADGGFNEDKAAYTVFWRPYHADRR